MLKEWLSRCNAEAEKEWLLRIVAMMVNLKSHINIRRNFEDENERK